MWEFYYKLLLKEKILLCGKKNYFAREETYSIYIFILVILYLRSDYIKWLKLYNYDS